MAAQLDRKKLRAIRREKSLTQEQLAEHCGISDQHMRSLETKRVNLSSNLLFQLSQALDVPMNDLMTVSDDHDPHNSQH